MWMTATQRAEFDEQVRMAEGDRDLSGAGFLVDRKRVDPSRVIVVAPHNTPLQTYAVRVKLATLLRKTEMGADRFYVENALKELIKELSVKDVPRAEKMCIETATGLELDVWAASVELKREKLESDAALRARVLKELT